MSGTEPVTSEAEKARRKAYYEANKEAFKIRSRAWYEANREVAIARAQARYKAKKEAGLLEKSLSGAENRRRRAAKGLPRCYSPAEKNSRKARREEIYLKTKAYIDNIKLSRGCIDCGYRAHPAALHFDHLPGTKKEREISRMRGLSFKRVEAEIAKCEVVCSNCHAIRTWNRLVALSTSSAENAVEA